MLDADMTYHNAWRLRVHLQRLVAYCSEVWALFCNGAFKIHVRRHTFLSFFSWLRVWHCMEHVRKVVMFMDMWTDFEGCKVAHLRRLSFSSCSDR